MKENKKYILHGKYKRKMLEEGILRNSQDIPRKY